jgi:hypothetical protein
VLLSALAIILWHFSLKHIHPYRSPTIGLVKQLDAFWWLAAGLAAVAIVLELRRQKPRVLTMCASLFALALILHGTLPATESVPRFSTAYDIAGFSQLIGSTGHTLPRIDARMSWPAMFAAVGMAARAMDVSTLWFLRWCPLVLNLAYLIPLKSIANTCLRNPRAQWAACGLFLASNWIDQDYFSPQGLNLFLFLVAVAIVIRVFANGGSLPWPVTDIVRTRVWDRAKRLVIRVARLPYNVQPSERGEVATTTGYRVAMLAVLLVTITASAVSHQITPAAMCLVFFGLMLTGRTGLRMLWLFTAVLVWAWLSWEGHTYWAGHLSKVFGSAGQFGSTLNSTVGSRLQSTLSGRKLVQDGRLLAAAITLGGAAIGFWAVWRRGRSLWTPAIVAIAPVAVAGAVSYGGEVALRVLLFSLAPFAIITAGLIDTATIKKWSALLLAAIAAALLILFPLARYGNESFEAIAPNDLAAATWIHAHVGSGAIIFVANRDEPLNYTGDGSYKTIELGGLLAIDGQELGGYLPFTKHPTYVFLTRSQNNYGVDFDGFQAGWLNHFKQELLSTGYVTVVYHSATATVLRIEKLIPPKKTVHDRHLHTAPPSVRPKVTPTTRVKVTPTTRVHIKVVPTTRPKPVKTPKTTTTTAPVSPTTEPPSSSTTPATIPTTGTGRPFTKP